jgi:8-oxo-dGTP pyrophosphatase MutT (NUDIX family)
MSPSQQNLFPDDPVSHAAPAPRKLQKSKPRNRKSHPAREHSAGFILFRNSDAGPLYLLLDYGKHWDYPKGHLEAGESPWQAAVRELREETGIRQVDRVTAFQQDMHYNFFSPKKGRIAKTVTYFLGQTRTEDVVVSHEHKGYLWLPYDQALEKLTYKNAKDLLTAAHKALQQHATPTSPSTPNV